MTKLYLLAGIIVVLIIAFAILKGKFTDTEKQKAKYQYKRKDFFMSRAEHECFDALVLAIGDTYHVFPQVHLPTIIDSKVVGQNWNAAFRHVSQKSVDFVLCDKAYIAAKLAIELDDKTHQRQDRIERDGEIERILKATGLPLLRLENHGHFNQAELAQKIKAILGNT
ncbi:MAG: hypothetical protein RL641_444 [Candidatus Parcubacteria bacterium]|jgi:very-short-patch-repair endonuclease